MATVRQQTVVQTSSTGGSLGQQLDNSLDALLEDLQTSVARSPPGAMNGLATHEYREVRRTVRQEANTVPQDLQVQYLSAANPTTVVAERSASPLIQNDGQRTVAYKTMTYQYNTSGSQSGIGNVLDTTTTTTSTDSTSDARLRKNLNELDNLLVDLNQAQKGSYSSPSAGSARSTLNRVEVSSTRGIDSGLLEPVDMSTPLPPARQPHVSRSTQFQQQQQQYYSSGGRSASADNAPSPRLQPRRSTSAQRELVFDGPAQGGAYYRDKSPSNQRLQREMFYSETKSSTSPRYRELSPEKSPSSQRVYYETKTTGGQSAPWPNRYRDPSPNRYRDPSPDPGSSRVTTVRTYNYSTQGGSSPAPPLREPSPENVSRNTTVRSYNYTGGSPAPPHRETSPDPGSSRVTTMRTYNYSGGPAPPLREPSPDPGSRTTTVRTYNYSGGSPAPPRREPSPDPASRTTTVRTYNYTGSPAAPRRDPFPEVPIPVSTPQVITYQTPSPQPGTKVTTTVRTYTYELPPGQQGYGEPPSAYHVSPQPPRDKEPLVPAVAIPQQPDQPPTVITYKYSSHSTHNTSNKYPGAPRPEEQQPLLPRPFPTPSPTPAFPTDNQPPKRLDDLMASFSDTEPDSPPGKNYYITEKHTTTSTSTNSPAAPNLPQSNGVGMPAPSLKEEEAKKTEVKERAKTTNKAGPPVYYPPGVELFAKKEESMAMSASGKKASGRYEYEASKESKSKSSSSGGAAVVPVCLPVCCAMPCVIM